MNLQAQPLIVIVLCYVSGLLAQEPSCVHGKFSMDLNRRHARHVVTPSLSAMGITVLSEPSENGKAAYRRESCSKTALLKVNFERLTASESTSNRCGPGLFCGRKMLKIEMTLSKEGRTGHLFDFGDSQTNDGYDGDAGTQSNDAELHATGSTVTQYSNDYCEPKIQKLDIFTDALSSKASKATVWISNKYVRIQNNKGYDQQMCHRCLWALNGQSDKEGTINEDIFLALNRVVRGNRGRYGYGICRVKISWVCEGCGV